MRRSACFSGNAPVYYARNFLTGESPMKIITTTCVAVLAALFMFASTGSSEAAKKAKKAAAAPQPEICFMAWQPVCGMKAGKKSTYSNACVARNDGAKVVSKGECKPKAAKKAKKKKK
jgi:hypothetical protein